MKAAGPGAGDMGGTIIPSMRYLDAPAAIEFLVEAFGFEAPLVVRSEGDPTIVEHAQLTHGTGMIMLGSHRPDGGMWPVLPVILAGGLTQGCYVVIEDVDGHCEQARAADATITGEPEDQPYGGRLYSCLDLEGHPWSFGSYDPWAESGA